MPAGSVGRWYARHLGVNAHSLRHRYATRAYHAGKDINAVQELLGHASIATTQVYLSVADADLVRAASGAWTAEDDVPAPANARDGAPNVVQMRRKMR